MRKEEIEKVSIRFKAGAYTAYRNMNNKIWYALAEYVDNAVQSYADNKSKLREVEGDNYQFEVKVEVDPKLGRIQITDNAAGINSENFLRAFEPANIPLDRTGLSEFGMGLKVASIWFGDKYNVRSKAIGEDYERSVNFDLIKVTSEGKEDLDVQNTPKPTDEHYTVITITGLSSNAPTGNANQMARIKNHLTSIYRKFISNGDLRLVFNGDVMTYEQPKYLKAAYFDDPRGESVVWKKDVHFEAGGYKVTGFIGLLQEMSGTHSGISLFRRGRIIEGSHDEKYHPKILCGSPGSPRDKRLFGDLELEGFEVSFEKGSFLNTEDFDVFLEAFKEDLSKPGFNLLRQGDKYRKGTSPQEKKKAAKNIAEKLEKESSFEETTITLEELKTEIQSQPEVDKIQKDAVATTVFEYDNTKYDLELNITNDISDKELYNIYPLETKDDGSFKVKAKLNLDNSFFEKYNSNFKKESDYYPVIEIIKSFIFSEIIAMRQGTKDGGNIRKNFNHLIQKMS